MKVYISGPITGHEGYREQFGKAEQLLLSEGHEVLNPAAINFPSWFEHADYMRADLAMLASCDAIYMLRGWEMSEGARREHERALRAKKLVLFEVTGSPADPGWRELPNQARNAIKRNGIETMEQLCRMSESELLGLRNVGKKTLKSIKAALAKQGLRLREP